MSRIVIGVQYGARDYEVTATLAELTTLSGPKPRTRSELFAEIDRSVAKMKAAIEADA